MDPTNPRWEHSEQRRQRSATFWKIMVGAAAGAALSTVIVASCLDRGEARRDRDRDQQEPGIVETTAMSPTTAAPAAEPAAAPSAPATGGASTSDSTGGVQAANTTTAAPVVAPPATAVNNNTTVTSADMQRSAQAAVPAQNASVAPGANDATAAAATGTNASTNVADAGPTSAPTSSQGNADSGVVRDARGNVIDPNNPGSNPQAPAMSAGAGRFNTEAPYWSATSFPTNPEAGAGPFTTERNSPAYGLWGAYGQ